MQIPSTAACQQIAERYVTMPFDSDGGAPRQSNEVKETAGCYLHGAWDPGDTPTLSFNSNPDSIGSCGMGGPCICMAAPLCTESFGNTPNQNSCLCGTSICYADRGEQYCVSVFFSSSLFYSPASFHLSFFSHQSLSSLLQCGCFLISFLRCFLSCPLVIRLHPPRVVQLVHLPRVRQTLLLLPMPTIAVVRGLIARLKLGCGALLLFSFVERIVVLVLIVTN